MRSSHTLALAFGTLLALLGGGFIAAFVGPELQAPKTKPIHLWNHGLFILGVVLLVLGLAIMLGVLIDYLRRARQDGGKAGWFWQWNWRAQWRRTLRLSPVTLRNPFVWRGFRRGRIVIVSAAYTGPTGTHNCRDVLRSLIKEDGTLDFFANNQTLGDDPSPNATKTLTIVYKVGRRRGPTTVTYTEGEHVVLPP